MRFINSLFSHIRSLFRNPRISPRDLRARVLALEFSLLSNERLEVRSRGPAFFWRHEIIAHLDLAGDRDELGWVILELTTLRSSYTGVTTRIVQSSPFAGF